MTPVSPDLALIQRRYAHAIPLAIEWLEKQGRSQSWLAKQIGVEKSVLSRFLNPADDIYSPHPDRPRMMEILDGIERICLPDTRDFFLSHSSKDKELARSIVADLEADVTGERRLTVWFDEAEIQPGQSIVSMVNRGIETSKYVGILMTPDYFNSKSGWTDAEWHAVLHGDPDNRTRRLIPLIGADCPVVPALLRHLLMIDLRGKKYADGISRLVCSLRDRPLPRPVTHRGQLIPSTTRVDRLTLIAERTLPDADPDLSEEQLFCNLLPIERLPQWIYIAPIAKSLRKVKRGGDRTLPTKQAIKDRIHEVQRASGQDRVWTPSFRLHGDSLVTFHDLEDAENPLAEVVDADEISSMSTLSYLRDVDARNIVLALLNMGIDRHLTHPRRGLLVDADRAIHRFYFPDDSGTERIYKWMPVRRQVSRTVAKPYMKGGKITAWLHQACLIRAIYLASRFYIQLRPTRLLTADGKHVRRGSDVGRIVTRWLAQERNIHVLYNVRFWTSVMRSGRGPISIRAGDQWMEVSTVPAMVQQSYGIESDHKDLLGLLDLQAPQLAELEDDLMAIDEALAEDEASTESVDEDESNDINEAPRDEA